MDPIKKVLVCDGRYYFWRKGDLHTKDGFVKEKDIKSKKIIKSNTGKEFYIFDAKFSDKIKKIKRGPQAIMEKDIGLIISNTGIGKNSIVAEGGTGSGKLTAFLANICKKVYSYEVKAINLKIAKENMKFLKIKNVVFKNKNIKKIKEKDLDLIVLDLPNPHDYIKECYKALKSGGHLVVYVPTITQINEFIKENKEFVVNKIVELLERPWIVEGRKVRPNSHFIGHTAFLLFCRK